MAVTMNVPETVTLGTAFNITLTGSLASGETVSLYYQSSKTQIGGQPLVGPVTIATGSTAVSFSVTLPVESFAPIETTSKTVSVSYRMDVVKGTTVTRSWAINNATIPSASAAPAISNKSAYDDNATVSSQFDAFLQNESTIGISCTVTPKFGATVSSVLASVTVGATLVGTYQLSSDDGMSFALYNLISIPYAGDMTISYTATDSRGYSTTDTLTGTAIKVYPYAVPLITAFTVSRCNSSGVVSDDGTYLLVTYNYAISSVTVSGTAKNTKDIKFQYLVGSTWTDASISKWPTDWTKSGSFITNETFDPDLPYTVRLLVSDYLTSYSPAARNIYVPTSFTLVNFSNTGKALAFGTLCPPGAEDTFYCDLLAEFYKKVTMGQSTYKNWDTAFEAHCKYGLGQWDDNYQVTLRDLSDAYKATAFEIEPVDASDLTKGAYASFPIRPRMADGTLLGLDAADRITEEGTSGIWTYRKWASGTVELWGKKTYSSLSAMTAFGALYRTTDITIDNYPFSVYNANVQVSTFSVYNINNSQAFPMASSEGTSSAPPTYWLVRPTQGSSVSGGFMLYVRGTLTL